MSRSHRNQLLSGNFLYSSFAFLPPLGLVLVMLPTCQLLEPNETHETEFWPALHVSLRRVKLARSRVKAYSLNRIVIPN